MTRHIATRNGKVPTECVTWRWKGNLGDDMLFAAQAAMFGETLGLGQYLAAPEAVLVGGGTFVPKAPHHPELVDLSRRLPTAFFGTGIGDPLFWGTDHIPDWLEILRNARYIGVRGPISKERLREWGVPGHRVEWIGDPALYFAQREAGRHRLESKLAVNLATTWGQMYGFDEEAFLRTVIVALKRLVRAGWDITLVCAWKPDDDVIDRIQAEVDVSAVEHWHADYRRALESMEKFDIVLCEKLHVGVVAACKGVPFVALNYRSKVMDFCRSIGWERFCISTEDLEPEEILDPIAALARARDDHSDRLLKGVFGARERLFEAVPNMVAALSKVRA
jgi:polysaccharide pyruvyl transferase WcaK-like protein